MSRQGTPASSSAVRKPSSRVTASRRRRGTVVHVARDQHRVHLLLDDALQNLVQEKALVIEQRALADALAQMQVGQMQDFHRIPSLCVGCVYYSIKFAFSGRHRYNKG